MVGLYGHGRFLASRDIAYESSSSLADLEGSEGKGHIWLEPCKHKPGRHQATKETKASNFVGFIYFFLD